jgi:hypothetical protein
MNGADGARRVFEKGNAPREDGGLFKTPARGTQYELEAEEILRLMKDDSNASYNAATKVFKKGEVQNGNCHTHAFLIWLDKNKGLFNCQASKKFKGKKRDGRPRRDAVGRRIKADLHAQK